MSAKENRLARLRENIRERIQYYVRLMMASILVLTVVGGGLVVAIRAGVWDTITIIGILIFIGDIGFISLLGWLIHRKFKQLENTM